MEKRLILHITRRDQWEKALAERVYRAASLDAEGFIHCSRPSQVTSVASYLFRGQQGLVLLCIDTTKLKSPLKYDKVPSGELFPHIYGPLNIDAVIRVLDFPPKPDGTFDLPRDLYGKPPVV